MAALKVEGWREDGPELMETDAGDIAGDTQAGASYSRRYVFGPVEGRYLVVDDYTYVERWGQLDGVDPDPEYPYGVGEVTHYAVCTDPDEPGGTEVSADVQHGEGSVFGYKTAEEADEKARSMIRRAGLWTVEDYDPTAELRVGVLRR